MSVTANPANVSQGAETITFNGQLTAIPAGGGSAVAVGGAIVDVSINGAANALVGTTAGDGSFTYSASGPSAAADYVFSVAGTNLYGAASKDVQIGTAQSTTNVSVSPSQSFVTQGANNVMFTGQVTVTPSGGGQAVAIGAGVPVQVSVNGQPVTTVTTDDANGDFNYQATGLTAATTPFSFSVASAGLYSAGVANFSIPAMQAATTVSVTPSQGSIELGSQNVIFNGQVMITTPGSPGQQPIGAGISVTITGGSFSSTATTDSSGKFSVTDSAIATATNFTLSVAQTNLYSSGSAQVQIEAAAPAQTKIAMTSSGVITFGSPAVNLNGTVTAVNASSTSVPVAGAPVYLNGGATPVATTDANGRFSYPVSSPPANPTYTFSVNADANNLYTASSTPITVTVTPGQTNVTVQRTRPRSNGGPQQVTFTVTVDVTPAGTGATPSRLAAASRLT